MATLLVADDSETILLLMRTRLEMAGYTVETASDGQEVLDHIGNGLVPDLLLLDAMMPRKSGIDALRELRGAGWDVPALIVSAHQNRGDADAPPTWRSRATSPSRSTSTSCSRQSPHSPPN
jgi:two-component system, chemotaxis family, chemotaxis protein CheY